MPYLDTPEKWLAQSAHLLKARPNTTRITTKYRINPPVKRSRLNSRKRRAEASADPSSTTELKETTQTFLVLKTYDTVEGITLKYKTDKAADVGRLIASLGRLGRNMAGLPESTDVIMDEAPEIKEEEVAVQTPPAAEVKPPVAAHAKAGSGAPPTGKKGKKKGKK